jgi:hypothetical protein
MSTHPISGWACLRLGTFVAAYRAQVSAGTLEITGDGATATLGSQSATSAPAARRS